MVVEHVVPFLPSDEERIGLADEQLITFLDGMRAASRAHKRWRFRHTGATDAIGRGVFSKSVLVWRR